MMGNRKWFIRIMALFLCLILALTLVIGVVNYF